MQSLEKTLKNAIERVGAEDEAARRKIYHASLRAFAKLPDQVRQMRRMELEAAILSIESEYSDLKSRKGAKGASAEGALQANVTSRVNPSNLTLSNLFRMGAIAVVSIGMLLAGWFLGAYLEAGQTDPLPEVRSSADEKVKRSPVNGSLGSITGVERLVAIEFASDTGKLVDQPTGELSSGDVFSGMIESGEFVIRGEQAIFTREAFPIDPERVYIGTVEFSVEDPRKPIKTMSAGFATLDANGEVERDGAGPHRYFIHSGGLRPSVVFRTGNRGVISGVISKRGNDGFDSFRPGTQSVRPALWIDTGNPSRWIKLHSMTIESLE